MEDIFNWNRKRKPEDEFSIFNLFNIDISPFEDMFRNFSEIRKKADLERRTALESFGETLELSGISNEPINESYHEEHIHINSDGKKTEVRGFVATTGPDGELVVKYFGNPPKDEKVIHKDKSTIYDNVSYNKKDNVYQIAIDAPGVKEEDIKIDKHRGYVKIKYGKNSTKIYKDKLEKTLSENYGIKGNVDLSSVDHIYKNGILSVNFKNL